MYPAQLVVDNGHIVVGIVGAKSSNKSNSEHYFS